MPGVIDSNVRKRKLHSKSRKGCGNCKLRRVKCDERRPHCQKCTSYGVACNYNAGHGSDLHFEGVGSFCLDDMTPKPPVAPHRAPCIAIPKTIDAQIDGLLGQAFTLHTEPGVQADHVYIGERQVALLRLFQSRTVLTVGTAETSSIYQEHMTRLATEHGFLLHMVLRFTLMHSRYLTSPASTPATAEESFHAYHGAALLNKILSEATTNQIQLSEGLKDAMWGSAALLGACAFADIETDESSEAWPLKVEPDVRKDLDWLKMGEGKREVWRITNPLREGSLWREALNFEIERGVEGCDDAPDEDDELIFGGYGMAPKHKGRPVHPELDQLFPYVARLSTDSGAAANSPASNYLSTSSPTSLNSTDNASPDSVSATTPEPFGTPDCENPYHMAASLLSRLLPLPCTHQTVMWFLSFVGHMEVRFRLLLAQKDPTALLLLAVWYAKLIPYNNAWWAQRRACIECKAICLWLDARLGRDGKDRELRNLLRYPWQACGLGELENQGPAFEASSAQFAVVTCSQIQQRPIAHTVV